MEVPPTISFIQVKESYIYLLGMYQQHSFGGHCVGLQLRTFAI